MRSRNTHGCFSAPFTRTDDTSVLNESSLFRLKHYKEDKTHYRLLHGPNTKKKQEVDDEHKRFQQKSAR